MLSVTSKPFMQCNYAECRYAECHYAECRYAECHYAECRYAECCGAAYFAGALVPKEKSVPALAPGPGDEDVDGRDDQHGDGHLLAHDRRFPVSDQRRRPVRSERIPILFVRVLLQNDQGPML